MILKPIFLFEILLLLALMAIFGCNLSNRDTNFKGKILSQDELLKFQEWHYSTGNVTTYIGDKKINSVALDTPKYKVEFSLADDETVFFTLNGTDNNKGEWDFNSNDSTIDITFNKVDAIKGKLVKVTNSDLVISNIQLLDSTRQVITVWYS